ncbi:MAG: RNA-dependent RNA polymerase [Erysiphe necator ourmia-like virus 82]|nr:MAG: RNA-dependent RNA polymerase [Erysiphe necator ourmia-like virus 82]
MVTITSIKEQAHAIPFPSTADEVSTSSPVIGGVPRDEQTSGPLSGALSCVAERRRDDLRGVSPPGGAPGGQPPGSLSIGVHSDTHSAQQPRNPSANETRKGTDVIPVGKRIDNDFEHWVDGKGGEAVMCCRDRRCPMERDWQLENGIYPRLYCTQKSTPAPPPRATPFPTAFRNFPYKGAHTFRDGLLSKRATYDPEWVITEAIARLGPQEDKEIVTDKVLEEYLEPLTNSNDQALEANPYAVLHDEREDGCTASGRLRGRAKKLVKFYEELGMTRSAKEVPQHMICGDLRSAVRQCFIDRLSPIDELSFKTIQKLEKSCCKFCLPRFEQKLDQWKQARFQPVAVDVEHLGKFRRALRQNIEKGWDRQRAPFIPNGNATRRYRRKEGGNWNVEEFSGECRYELVFSSGKPRVVTLYSAENTRRLAPLHYSLYSMLKRRGWLLVGEPTDQHVRGLTGASFLSFDYSSATDNIKREYVKVAVEVLEEQADYLSEEEIQALRVLSNLVIDGKETFSGQPMGSVMSFPLLCVINKTVVDMALSAMLDRKEISFNECVRHPLLVNGDDLLTREVRGNTDLRGEVVRQGSQVGLVVNEEKTMVSESDGEINSTYFQDGCKQRKFNASSLWMDAGVEDVLGFAAQATPDGKTFRKVVRRNLHTLAKQPDKHLREIPLSLVAVCRKDKQIRKAITSLPVSVAPIKQGGN